MRIIFLLSFVENHGFKTEDEGEERTAAKPGRRLAGAGRSRVSLTAKKELCICEIMDALALAQYNISRHVRELRFAGLVRERKEGKFVFYCLCKPGDKAHALLLKAIAGGDKEVFSRDIQRLRKRLDLRVDGKCVVGIKRCC